MGDVAVVSKLRYDSVFSVEVCRFMSFVYAYIEYCVFEELNRGYFGDLCPVPF